MLFWEREGAGSASQGAAGSGSHNGFAGDYLLAAELSVNTGPLLQVLVQTD